jgi:putative nucleotidyltransferase with HDIG domain
MSERLSLSQIRAVVDVLPTLPEAVREVLQVLERDELSVDRCIALIEQDQALAARTLRVANSPFYGMSGRVTRIGDAISVLGLRAMAGVLATAAMSNALQPRACEGFSFAGYWRHALGVALFSRALAPRWDADAEQAFLAGLMHDSGKLVLAAHFPAEASAAWALATQAEWSSQEAELATLSLSHEQIGAALASHWRFPTVIVQAIAHHHQVDQAPVGEGRELAALVHLSDAMAHALGLYARAGEAVPQVEPHLWLRLGLAEDAGLELLARVEQSVKELSDALSI